MMGRLISFSLLSFAAVAGGTSLTGGFMQDAGEWQPAGMGRPVSHKLVSVAAAARSKTYFGGVVVRAEYVRNWFGLSVAGSAKAQDRDVGSEADFRYNRPPKFARIVIKPEKASDFEGTGEPGQSVEILVDKTDVRQAEVGSDGRWRLLGPPLGPGDHQVEVSVGLPGQSQRLIGQQVRIAIPKTKAKSDIVAYEQSEAERAAELRARAERLARDASHEFDRFGRAAEAPAKKRVRTADNKKGSDNRGSGNGSRRSGDGSDDTRSGPVGWLSRSQRDYFDYVVPELARKGGTGSSAPRGNVPPPVRPGDKDQVRPGIAGDLPSVNQMVERARDWMKSANRTYQEVVVDDLRTGSTGGVVKQSSEEKRQARVDTEKAETRAKKLAAKRAEELRRKQAEEERRRQAELAQQRADAQRRKAEERDRLAKLKEAEEEKRRLDELLARRAAEHDALVADKLENERLAREKELQEEERRRVAEEAAEAERRRLEAERLRAEIEARAKRERLEAEAAAAERKRLARLESERVERERLAAEEKRVQAARRNEDERLRNKELRVARIGELSDEAGFGRRSESKALKGAGSTEAETPKPQQLNPSLSEILERKAERARTIAHLTDTFRIPNWNAVEKELRRDDEQAAEEQVSETEQTKKQSRFDEARRGFDVSARPKDRLKTAENRGSQDRSLDKDRSTPGAATQRRYSLKDNWAANRGGARTAGWAARFPPIPTGCADERAGRTIVPPGTYVVAQGDTLWYISWRHYQRGELYWKIYRANRRRISSPRRLYPCQKIWLPRLSR